MDRKELNWWLNLGQIDFDSIYKKTKKKLERELYEHTRGVWRMPKDWHKKSTLKEAQSGAKEIVRALKNPDSPKPTATYTISEQMVGATSVKRIDFSEGNIEGLATAAMLEALREAFITPSDLKTCPQCGNIFVQVRPNMEKKYCSTNCIARMNAEKAR